MKKLFAKKFKEPTPEEAKEALDSAGIPTKYSSSRAPKFSQYSDYANQLNATNGRGSAPPPGSNPYAAATMGAPSGANPYGGASTGGYGGNAGASYHSAGQQYNNQGYHSQPSIPQYGGTSPAPSYRTTSSASPYATAENDYNNRFGGTRLAPQPSTDTFEASRNQLFGDAGRAPPQNSYGNAHNNNNSYNNTPDRAALFGAAVGGASSSSGAGSGSGPIKPAAPLTNDDELLMTSSELAQNQGPEYYQNKYNGTGGNSYGGNDSDRDSEDEDVEAVKSQMRYVKKESVNVARDALMSAARAEESGRNTLGMLGAQGERIANTERSLALASTQNKIAEEKARELKTLNRSMFAVHVGNPFNSKRRLQEKEEQIKNNRRLEQQGREDRRQAAYESSQRVTNGMSLAHSETAQKYASQRNREGRAKYQFEADSEDEDLENEIDRSLDALAGASSRLNKLALTANEEIKSQNARLDIIANEADDLDVGVHLNTNRLMNIK